MKPLLEFANEELLAKLHKFGKTKSFFEGEEIFAEGDKAEYLPIVLSGQIKMVRFPEIGKEVIIGVFRAGEMFAVPPAFDGRNFPSTAIAMEETKLLIIYRKDFLNLLRESSEFSFAVIEWMSEMLREKTATIQNLVTASPEHRVGNVLLRLAKKEEKTSNVKISMRRQDIAEMAGLTTETTIRAVKKLAEKELVKIIHGKIILEQPEKLRSFLG
ncbi:MAG TPA: Crp/Fnr family transcriptional regulator [Pyrinomonadaceae bacterium]|nr:Crp/Fnr family transcriptional regulator [Pyrinomonadaceae bacterium]